MEKPLFLDAHKCSASLIKRHLWISVITEVSQMNLEHLYTTHLNINSPYSPATLRQPRSFGFSG